MRIIMSSYLVNKYSNKQSGINNLNGYLSPNQFLKSGKNNIREFLFLIRKIQLDLKSCSLINKSSFLLLLDGFQEWFKNQNKKEWVLMFTWSTFLKNKPFLMDQLSFSSSFQYLSTTCKNFKSTELLSQHSKNRLSQLNNQKNNKPLLKNKHKHK